MPIFGGDTPLSHPIHIDPKESPIAALVFQGHEVDERGMPLAAGLKRIYWVCDAYIQYL